MENTLIHDRYIYTQNLWAIKKKIILLLFDSMRNELNMANAE